MTVTAGRDGNTIVKLVPSSRPVLSRRQISNRCHLPSRPVIKIRPVVLYHPVPSRISLPLKLPSRPVPSRNDHSPSRPVEIMSFTVPSRPVIQNCTVRCLYRPVQPTKLAQSVPSRLPLPVVSSPVHSHQEFTISRKIRFSHRKYTLYIKCIVRSRLGMYMKLKLYEFRIYQFTKYEKTKYEKYMKSKRKRPLRRNA